MEIENNNIEYDVMVKKTLSFLLYRAEYYSSRVGAEWSKARRYDESFDYIKAIHSLSDYTRSIIALILTGLLIILPVTGILNQEMSIGTGLVFIFIFSGGFVLGLHGFITRIKISSRYKQMERYFSLKGTLTNSLNALKGQITFDIKNEGINPINVELIGKMISDIGEVFSYIDGPMKDFSQLRDAIETNTVELLDKIVFTEKNEIIKFAQDFYNLLQLWLENHRNELKKELDSLAQNQNETILMAKNRLKIYIDSTKLVQI